MVVFGLLNRTAGTEEFSDRDASCGRLLGKMKQRACDPRVLTWKRGAVSFLATGWAIGTPANAEFIGPEEGMLACGYEGIGRLWSVDEIVERALAMIAEKK